MTVNGSTQPEGQPPVDITTHLQPVEPDGDRTGSSAGARLVPIVAAVAALAIATGAAMAVHSSNSGKSSQGTGAGQPALLHLAGGTVGEGLSALPAAGADSSGSSRAAIGSAPVPNQLRYRLTGALPTGPAKASVYRPSAPDDAALDRLARAFGLHGDFKRSAGAALLSDKGRMLRVELSSGAWYFTRDTGCGVDLAAPSSGAEVAPDSPVTCTGGVSASAGSGTASASGGVVAPNGKSTPLPSDPGDLKGRPIVLREEALAIAKPVLTALRLSARPQVQPGEVATITVATPVDGHATSGLQTLIAVDPKGVVFADGWIGRVQRGDDYPVISAKDAYAQIARLPVPEMLLACDAPAMGIGGQRKGSTTAPLATGGCPSAAQLDITGATLGLSLGVDGNRPVLVPAWLFAIKGSTEPLPIVAVDPRYLAPPTIPSEDPKATSVPGGLPEPDLGSASAAPDSAGPASPPAATK